MSAQDLEQRARGLLAAEYPDDPDYAEYLIVGESIDLFDDDARALRAIVAALRQQPAPVVDDARMARALEWLRAECGFYNNPEAHTHIPAIEEAIAAYDPNCGARTVRVVDDAMVDAAMGASAGGYLVRDCWFSGEKWARELMRAALAAARAQGVQS